MFIAQLTNQQRWVAAGAASLAMTGVLGLLTLEAGDDGAARDDPVGRLHTVAGATLSEPAPSVGLPWIEGIGSAADDAIEAVDAPLRQGTATASSAVATAQPSAAASGVTLVVAESAGTASHHSSSGDEPSTASPHQIVITLPSYEAGRAPSVTPGTVNGGKAPSVAQTGPSQYIVDLGTAPTITPATVDPGASGRLTPPSVEIR